MNATSQCGCVATFLRRHSQTTTIRVCRTTRRALDLSHACTMSSTSRPCGESRTTHHNRVAALCMMHVCQPTSQLMHMHANCPPPHMDTLLHMNCHTNCHFHSYTMRDRLRHHHGHTPHTTNAHTCCAMQPYERCWLPPRGQKPRGRSEIC